jgi:predicted ferric reductase
MGARTVPRPRTRTGAASSAGASRPSQQDWQDQDQDRPRQDRPQHWQDQEPDPHWQEQDWRDHDGGRHDGGRHDGDWHDGGRHDGDWQDGDWQDPMPNHRDQPRRSRQQSRPQPPERPESTAAEWNRRPDVHTAGQQVWEKPQMAVPSWWGTVCAGLGWSSVSIVVAFWVANGGPQGMRTPAGAATGLGLVSGLVSADLLLLQVLLMARIPVLERSYGQDGLARIHRRFGFWSLNLLLVHIALITLGEALAAGKGVIDQFVAFVLEYPGVLLATAATGLLILVAVTSIRRARRRLRYESWHLIHLYAYLGVGLSIPHELSAGRDFTASPLAAAYWWTIYLAALGAVLIWRVCLPVYRMLRHGLVVEGVVREGPGVVSVHLRGRNLDRLNAGAGQFFLWRFLDGRGWVRAHPYSLSAAPTADRLRITVKDLGDDSGRLASLPPGTRVLAEGPFGRLHSGVRTRNKVTLFAAGIGITPMRALLEELDFAPGEATLVYRAADDNELVLDQEIDALAQDKGARVHYLLGPRRRTRRGGSWLPQNAGTLGDVEGLVRLVPDINEHDVYMCGPDAWLNSLVRTLRRVGVPDHQIHLERFSW